MSDWKIAMLCLLPFIGGQVLYALWRKAEEATWRDLLAVARSAKLRVWIILICASALTAFTSSLFDYIAMDAICAAAVMARPKSKPQRMIGAMFVLMLMCDLGFYMSGQENWDGFLGMLTALGWLQFLILAGWTGHDIGKTYYANAGTASGLLLNRQGRS